MFFDKVKSAAFIGAHTDDEMICAGTLRKLVKAGAKVKVVTFSCARIKDLPENKSEKIVVPEFRKAMSVIGVKPEDRTLLNFKTRRLPEKRAEIRQYVYDFIGSFRPDAIFTLSPQDEHQDHEAVGEETERVAIHRVPLIIRCQYPFKYRSFHYNLFVLLTKDELEAKLAVVDAYQSQHFRYRYHELFDHCARADGLSVKGEYAEKFEIIRCVTG